MKQLKLLVGLVALVVVVASAHSIVLSSGRAKMRAKETKFKVRVENISNPAGQTASDGSRWPFALSPGIWALSKKNSPLFTSGKRVRALGLEAQAEDGNPSPLVKSLQGASNHTSKSVALLSGVFNMPVGATSPGPILPGGAFEFSFSATPGMKLSVAMMFGQSNDLFYAPDASLALFDAQGQPTSGDITSKFILWDAGTEVNQEPGIGPDQAPRQKMPNTGAAENGVVHPVKDEFSYPMTKDVLRITITPEM
jgi:hypothetical protein